MIFSIFHTEAPCFGVPPSLSVIAAAVPGMAVEAGSAVGLSVGSAVLSAGSAVISVCSGVGRAGAKVGRCVAGPGTEVTIGFSVPLTGFAVSTGAEVSAGASVGSSAAMTVCPLRADSGKIFAMLAPLLPKLTGISRRTSTSAQSAYCTRGPIRPRRTYLSAITVIISTDDVIIHSVIVLHLQLAEQGVHFVDLLLRQ